MDLNKLSPGERIIAAAGVLLLVDSFLPWFRFCIGATIFRACANHTAWGNPLSALAVLIAIAMVVQIGISRFTDNRMPPPGAMSWGQIHLFAGFAALALVVLQFLAGDSPMGRVYGIFVGLGLAAALAYGGMVRSREPTSEGGEA